MIVDESPVNIKKYAFEFEDVNNIIDSQEIISLHRAEVKSTSNTDFYPNREAFTRLQAMDTLLALTVRLDGKLVGYEVVIMDRSNHHPDTIQGVVDCIFIHPDHRRGGVGAKLILMMDNYLRELGVHEVFHSVSMDGRDWSPVLTRMNYKPFEKIYCRRL